MTYSIGDKIIAVQMRPLLGNVKPDLYIGEGNKLSKVASFGSVEKAESFEEMLRYFFGCRLEGSGCKNG